MLARMACRVGAAIAAALGVGLGSGASAAIGFAVLTHGRVETVAVSLAIAGALALCGATVVLWEKADASFRGRVLDASDVERIVRRTAPGGRMLRR